MKINEGVRLIGNFNRIREMEAADFDDESMCFTFKKDGIIISESDMAAARRIDKLFTAKSLSKEKTDKMIHCFAIVKDPRFDLPENQYLGYSPRKDNKPRKNPPKAR